MSSMCSIPSSVRSTLMEKKSNPFISPLTPPAKLLHQPFALRADSKEPQPSWPIKWLKY